MSERERRKCLDVLGLPHSSSDDDIKKAYRRLALQYHPDKNTEDGAKEQFQEISYAYKYLIEGPSAVGTEEEDEGIPVEVLLRLFPWLFAGGRFFHPGFHPAFHPAFQQFHNPFFPGFYNEVYIDSEDEDSYEEDFFFNHYEPKPKSTYVPNPSKEEKKKEKKKRAKERRKAAKMGKPQTEPKPKKENESPKQPSTTSGSQTSTAKNTDNTNTIASGRSSYSDDINNPDLKDKITPSPAADTAKCQTGSHDSSRPVVPPASNNPQSKKSKKKLKAEQRKREKEMESIANEFKKKQKQQAEKEARREAARKERKIRETTLQTQEADCSITDTDSILTANDDTESVRTDLDIEDEAAQAEIIDKEKDTGDDEKEVCYDDVDEIDDADLEVDGTEYVRNDNKTKDTVHGGSANSQKSGSVNSSTSRSVPNGGHQTRQGQKTQYRDYRSSSRGSEASGTSITSERHSQTSKKMKRHGRQKEASLEDWNDFEAGNSSSYDDLLPQTESEEMQMFNDAILMSEREAKLHGVIPHSEEEERIMLEAALQESQITANWHCNIDTLDDVSDGEDGGFSGHSTFPGYPGASAGAVGDWHKSVGKNTCYINQDKENVKSRSHFEAGRMNSSNGDIKLGDLGSGDIGFNKSTNSGVKYSQGAPIKGKKDIFVSESLEHNFNHTVGGKVKGASRKTKADGKKKGDNSWEFGGSGSKKPVFKTDNAEGLQFGLDEDMTFVNGGDYFSTANKSESKGSIQNKMSSAFNTDSPSTTQKSRNKQTGSGNMTEDIESKIRSEILAQLDHPKASATTGHSSGSRNVPNSQSTSVPASKHGSSHATSNTNVSSAPNLYSVIHDMDDIDDVDTFGESSAADFNLPAEPTTSFDLNIPAALCNKEKIKSYYQRKK